jgi:hypothetical protein
MQRIPASRRVAMAAVAAALVFGAAQAAAAPADESSARARDQTRCNEGCRARGSTAEAA